MGENHIEFKYVFFQSLLDRSLNEPIHLIKDNKSKL